MTVTETPPPPPPQPVAGAAAQTINAVKIYGQGETAVTAINGITVAFEHQRFTAPLLFGASVLMTIACVAIGVFPL